MSDDPRGENVRPYWIDNKAVGNFSSWMLLKLRSNKHKAHWDTVESPWLLNRLEVELDELRDALLTGSNMDVIKECADVANFAMMIADKHGTKQKQEDEK